MYRILLVFFALLLASNVESVAAARPTAYARAKMKGRTYTHRPFYKKYKGRKATKKRGLFRGKVSSRKSSYHVGHSTR